MSTTPAQQLVIMLQIAADAHARQENPFDKGGRPYFLHTIRVMQNLPSHVDDLVRCAAIGHDLFEDTDITAEILRKAGICEQVISDIELLSKNGKTPEQYKQGVMSNIRTIMCKMADIDDNSDIRRLKNKVLKAKDFARTMLYMEFYVELEELYLKYVNN